MILVYHFFLFILTIDEFVGLFIPGIVVEDFDYVCGTRWIKELKFQISLEVLVRFLSNVSVSSHVYRFWFLYFFLYIYIYIEREEHIVRF